MARTSTRHDPFPATRSHTWRGLLRRDRLSGLLVAAGVGLVTGGVRLWLRDLDPRALAPPRRGVQPR